MKNVIVAIVTLAISSAFSARAEWALVKILRDEPLPAPQRVAFIGSAEVKEVQGKAERLSGIDTWTPLRTDIRLGPGDMVRTQNGSVTIKMIDSRSFIKITPNTVLRLVPLDSNSDRSS